MRKTQPVRSAAPDDRSKGGVSPFCWENVDAVLKLEESPTGRVHAVEQFASAAASSTHLIGASYSIDGSVATKGTWTELLAATSSVRLLTQRFSRAEYHETFLRHPLHRGLTLVPRIHDRLVFRRDRLFITAVLG